MPTQCKLSATLDISSRVILERPRCASLLGAILAEWNNLEVEMAYEYSAYLFGPSLGGLITNSATVAIASFERINSFQQKIGILRGSASLRGIADDKMPEYRIALQNCQEKYSSRNALAHGRWAISDDYPEAIISIRDIRNKSQAWVYSETELHDMLEDVAALDAYLFDAFRAEIAPFLILAISQPD